MLEISSAPSSLFYLCTGFHRSGTSLIAQSLAKGGVHMGDELMGASFSNVLGHVEDMPIVRLHDRIFEINGADWRYSGNFPLLKPKWLNNYLLRYLQKRMQEGVVPGVKDPRAAFFLNNWQHAGGEAMRYVLVYRHWSVSVNSLLNRASRHIINHSSPILANKVNFSFWQEPQLAFEMWRTTNNAIINFYRQHSEQCLLISQNAFINNNPAVQRVANKIGLGKECLSASSFERGLMTDAVPDFVMAMLSKEHQQQLDETWSELQVLADVPANILPKISDYCGYPSASDYGYEQKVFNHLQCKVNELNIGSLSWDEALGFIADISNETVIKELIKSLLFRPFSQSRHYKALAKIAHKSGQFLLTRLCKMRAMYVEQGCWNITEWGEFVKPEGSWISESDALLEQANPFSLRVTEDLTGLDDMASYLLQAPWADVMATLSGQLSTALTHSLNVILLHRLIIDAAELDALAKVARDHKQFILAEFSLIKAVRLDYSAARIMALGDLYFANEMLLNAKQCFIEANELAPAMVAVIARLADVSLAMGELSAAEKYLHSARQIQPNHRVVKLCQQRMDSLLANKLDFEPTSATNNTLLHTMPLITSYEEVLDLTRQDVEAGTALDRYNQQLVFILRDNKRWLLTALKQLPQNSAECLASLIYKHWSKLWPASVLQNTLCLPRFRELEHKAFDGVKASPLLNLAVSMHVEHIDNAIELFEFINIIPFEADLLISTIEANEAKLLKLAENYSSGRVYIDIVGVGQDPMYSWIYSNRHRQLDYALICRIHDLVNVDHYGISNWRLQLLFCLLGSEQVIEKIITNFYTQPLLGLVIPPCHPNAAEFLSDKTNLKVLQGISQQLDLPLPGPLYIYPAGGMFWYRPEAFTALQDIEPNSISGYDIEVTLPLFAKQANYLTYCSTLLDF